MIIRDFEQNKDVIELKNNFNNLEREFNKLKNKINNELQNIKSDHENEIEEIKQNFQKLLTKINEEKEKIDTLEVKNQSLENEMKILREEMNEMINSLEKKNGMEKLNNKQVCFVQNKNKWKDIDSSSELNGYINITNDENIKYIKGKADKDALVFAENHFKKPEEYSINYSLYYFEVKCEIEGDNNVVVIGLENCYNNYIRYNAAEAKIKNCFQHYRLSTFSWNNNDTFGCGLVYPPTDRINELPYVFFTQNGKQIGKATLSKDNCNVYKPYIMLKHCSVEANFGNDLKVKPFSYDISKHFLINEFY